MQDICLALLEGYQTGWQAGMAGEKAKLSEVWMTSDARAKVNGAALTLPEQPRPVDDVERYEAALRNIEAEISQKLLDWHGSSRGDAFSSALSVIKRHRAALGHKDRGGE